MNSSPTYSQVNDQLQQKISESQTKLSTPQPLKIALAYLDEAMYQCEETHMKGIKQIDNKIATMLDVALTEALKQSGDYPPLSNQILNELKKNNRIKVSEALDTLFNLQRAILDTLYPERLNMERRGKRPKAGAVIAA